MNGTQLRNKSQIYSSPWSLNGDQQRVNQQRFTHIHARHRLSPN